MLARQRFFCPACCAGNALGLRDMIGHQSIIELRLQGYKPRTCWVNLYGFVPLYPNDHWHPEFQLGQDCHATVDILPDDVVQTLDLRFVHGLAVNVVGWHKARTLAVFDHAVKFAPAKMAAALDDVLMWYSPEVGVVDLNNPQRMAA